VARVTGEGGDEGALRLGVLSLLEPGFAKQPLRSGEAGKLLHELVTGTHRGAVVAAGKERGRVAKEMVELLTRSFGEEAIPVARDFDFSGIVNTRYATPNDKLGIRRVRDRLYRGYCFPDSNFTKAIALFNAKKDAIYALYHDKIGQLLKPDIVKETTEYIDDFYKTINNPRDAKRQLSEACFGRK